MEILLKDYFYDLFNSFQFDRDKIDYQIHKDISRLVLFFNGNHITRRSEFYRILNKLPFSDFFKRLIWILPTQVSMFPFYEHLHKKYKGKYIVVEIPEGTTFNNEFIININPISKERIDVTFKKNFRLVQSDSENNVVTVGYIFMDIFIPIRLSGKIDVKIQEYFI